MADKKTTPEPETPGDPNIHRFENGWVLITHGGWQVSVGPDGLIMLPRHLLPDEVEDFCAAATAAAEIGRAIRAANRANETPLGQLPSSKAMVVEGPPPPGYVPMPVREGPNSPPRQTSTIGRRSRNPRAPQAAMPGQSQQRRR
jgi:hypothetical protein